ncbi:NAD(P)/FAD-dependent oxidoreductase [bacterium]|nr:NAD(P)/FAD-dependent oxidoreductase [bacterium]
MEKVNIVVIGAGVVGLAIAEELSKTIEDVVVLEKERSFGRHTSSRNSEVIHSGIYYPKDSLKAIMCVEGAKSLYEYADTYCIPYNRCGKLIVANNDEEYKELDKLLEIGKNNGVEDLEIISQAEIKEIEPLVKASKALYVPCTGIINTHQLMETMEEKIEENGGFVIYDSEVLEIIKVNDGYEVVSSDGETYLTKYLINSAGLGSDKIAEMVGIDTKKYNLKLHLCKGEYYKDNSIKNIKHLIYPVPDPQGIFLGIHLTINLNSEVRFGPNAYYLQDVDYKTDDSFKPEFTQAIKRYIDIDPENLHFDDCGIRPKLQGPNDGFRDFYIQEESEKGFPNFINLIGIESPGLTSCLAIAKYVGKMFNR